MKTTSPQVALGDGRVINVSSVVGFVPNPFKADYVATKHVVEGYSESLATDPKPKLRYTAGSTAGRVSVLRRVAPAQVFDKSVGELNRMVG